MVVVKTSDYYGGVPRCPFSVVLFTQLSDGPTHVEGKLNGTLPLRSGT